MNFSFTFFGDHLSKSMSMCRGGAGSLLVSHSLPTSDNFTDIVLGRNSLGGGNIRVDLGKSVLHGLGN